MPPVTSTGISTNPAERIAPEKSARAQNPPYPQIKNPITAPIPGKKHIIYLMFSLSQSARGAGILENMAKAIKKLFQTFFIKLFHTPPGCLYG